MTDFYRNRRVMVLGGAGFVGKHLCRHLLEMGAAQVTVVDNLSRCKHQAVPEGAQMCWTTLDRVPPRIFEALVEDVEPFAVFNLAAAVAGVEYNQGHHAQMFMSNMLLQTVPVEVCASFQVPHYLQVSSACVYGEAAHVVGPAIEEDLGGEPVPANAGYAWAKRMGEQAVLWSNLPHAVIVRPSNIYGPGDWYDEKAHVIPKLIQAYVSGTPKLYDSNPVRAFLYVEDAARGMAHALAHGEDKGIYNLTTNSRDALSIWDLHNMIAVLTNRTPPQTPVAAEFDAGDPQRFSDASKMEGLHWRAETPLINGLQETIKDYDERRPTLL